MMNADNYPCDDCEKNCGAGKCALFCQWLHGCDLECVDCDFLNGYEWEGDDEN